MSKRQGLVAFLAAALSVGLPSIGYATTYSLDIGSNGSDLPSPVGTVEITGGGASLTYEFDVASGPVSFVYMDVTGNVTGVSAYGSSNSGATPTTLGTFADTVHIPLVAQGASEITVTFMGTGLAAGYTLLNGDIEVFSAATIDGSLVGDAPVTPLPATLPLFAGGIGALGLLMMRRRKQQNAGVVMTAL